MKTFFINLSQILFIEYQFLTFRHVKPDMKKMGNYLLIFGITTAWIAGMGRYWDNPKALPWQTLGLGSVAYLFILSFILWIIIMPLGPKNWNYRSVLIFVGMTSPPAILYAIPIERYVGLSTAQKVNVWFLAIVALWRVILYVLFLIRSAKMSGFSLIVATLSPLVLIVFTLTMLNLEHVVFQIMAGLKEYERSANDSAYAILFLISFLSIYASPFLLIAYFAVVADRIKKRNPEQKSKVE